MGLPLNISKQGTEFRDSGEGVESLVPGESLIAVGSYEGVEGFVHPVLNETFEEAGGHGKGKSFNQPKCFNEPLASNPTGSQRFSECWPAAFLISMRARESR